LIREDTGAVRKDCINVPKLLHRQNLAIEADCVSNIDLGSMNKGILMKNKDTNNLIINSACRGQ
jgi:hypothetical protein